MNSIIQDWNDVSKDPFWQGLAQEQDRIVGTTAWLELLEAYGLTLLGACLQEKNGCLYFHSKVGFKKYRALGFLFQIEMILPEHEIAHWLKKGFLDRALFEAKEELFLFCTPPNSKKTVALQHNIFKKVFPHKKLTEAALAELEDDFSKYTSQDLFNRAILHRMLCLQRILVEINDGEPVSKKTTVPLLIMKYPVTQLIWQQYMGENPSKYKSPVHPVERVSWFDSICFCNRISQACGLRPVYQMSSRFEQWLDVHRDMDILDEKRLSEHLSHFDSIERFPFSVDKSANGFRLPTETEWMFCAKNTSLSPSQSQYIHFGEEIQAQELRKTQIIASGSGNTFGVCDMLGNVWEWCWNELKEEPTRVKKGYRFRTKRLIKGGSWATEPELVTPTYSEYRPPEKRSVSVGLRLVRMAE